MLALCRAACAQTDPCQRPYTNGSLFDGLSAALNEKQRQQACIQERQDQWRDYYARQQQAKEAADAQAAKAAEAARAEQDAAAIRAGEEARALAAAQAQAAREAAQAEKARRLAYVEMVTAENSADNICKAPQFAKMVMENWNDFDSMKAEGIQAIDIEHFVTTKSDAENSVFACHGVFVTNKGFKVAGTFSGKKNIAGEEIFSWHRDESQDMSFYDEPPAPSALAPEMATNQSPVGAASMAGVSAAFAAGHDARQGWEAWIATLQGDEKEGALWWAANRNGSKKVACADGPSKDNATWSAGCLNAQQKLTPIDQRRRGDALFKKGWNSI
jgi:hypothetical protein